VLGAIWRAVPAAIVAIGCVPADGRPKAKADAGRSVAVRPARSVSRPPTPRPRPPRSPIKEAGAVTPPARKPAKTASAALGEPFEDDFERSELGPDWRPTSPVWRLDAGRLCGRGARNRPVWLKRRLPVNARIEFDAVSSSPDGDIKVEVWGDGKSFASGTSYVNATSYVLIFGGWKNQFHVLARLDEHAKDRRELKVDPSGRVVNALPVQPDQTYHFKIERLDGKTLRWMVDDIEVLSLADPEPLLGDGHEFLGFNTWEVPLCFDNLMITPLPA
jgi:hypothetical protein